MYNRAKEASIAAKLQGILGDGYEIAYDVNESCFTNCYYKGHLYKKVPNYEMRSDLNVCDYTFAANVDITKYYATL